jgi:alanine-alpha-ketoisovalerate/valine-pyruvate aminotransferase
MLAGMLYHGSVTEVMFPNNETIGYLGLSRDPETRVIVDHVFQSAPLSEKQRMDFEEVRRMSSLEYFCLTKNRSFGGSTATDKEKLLKIISDAKIVDRSE